MEENCSEDVLLSSLLTEAVGLVRHGDPVVEEVAGVVGARVGEVVLGRAPDVAPASVGAAAAAEVANDAEGDVDRQDTVLDPAGFGPAMAGKPMRTDRNPVQT